MGATPRVGTRLLLATHPNFKFFSNLPNSKNNNCQDGRVQDQAELPRGLRGIDQQADQDGVRGGARPWHEADGIPDQERRESCLPGHRQADHHGELHLKPWRLLLSWRRRSTRAFSTCTRWPEVRATATSATSLSPSTSESRWKASSPSAT